MLNIFNTHSAFTITELTNAINHIPNHYGRVGQMELFKDKSVRTRHIAIEEQSGLLNLLPTKAPGAPATVAERSKRKIRSFTIPHIPYEDLVLPEEVQGIRAFGSEDSMQGIFQVVADYLQTMRNKHAITLEHLRIGALKGIILDADGSELVNLYNEFEIDPKKVSFNFKDTKTDVKKSCLDIVRYMEKNLMGEVMTGIHALVSPEFFDDLTSHPQVKEAYNRWEDGRAFRDDMRNHFVFAGISFEEYAGEVSLPDGSNRRFIEKNKAHFFPTGTMSSFWTYYAPADFVETVNTLGQTIYARQTVKTDGRGIELHTQSNPLPLCLRPALLVEGNS